MTMPLVAGCAAAVSLAAALWGRGGGGGVRAGGSAFVTAIRATAEAMALRRGLDRSVGLRVRLVRDDELRAAQTAATESHGDDFRNQARQRLHAALGLGPMPAVASGFSVSLPSTAAPVSPPPPLPSQPATGEVWGGLYDPSSGRVLVSVAPSAPPRPKADVDPLGLCHDLGLAILDRKFHLAAFLEGNAAVSVALTSKSASDDANIDALVARQALVEGDALVQALEHLLPGGLPGRRGLATAALQANVQAMPAMSPEQPESLVDPAAPSDASNSSGSPTTSIALPHGRLERERRWFPHTAGLTFVASFRARWPWKQIDSVWASPPQSTEQVLHPEKYERADHPDALATRLPLGAVFPWEARAQDTLGELGVRAFLSRTSDAYHAERAATGWGGDRAIWLESASDAFAVWVTTWDDETDARDFAQQARVTMAALSSGDSITAAVGTFPAGADGRGYGAADADRGASSFEDESAPAPAPAPALSSGPANAPAAADRAEHWIDATGRRFAIATAPRAVGLLFGAPAAGDSVLHRFVTAAARPLPPRQVFAAPKVAKPAASAASAPSVPRSKPARRPNAR